MSNNEPLKGIQKLKVSEYVFEIDNKDIVGSEVKYEIANLESCALKNGKWEKGQNYPVINIELSGKDSDGRDAWICFEVNMDLEKLNKYTQEPTNIIEYISDCEAFIKRPTKEYSQELDLYFPTNSIDDMHRNLSSIWISKQSKNVFMFKVCVPSDKLFAYFVVDFNK